MDGHEENSTKTTVAITFVSAILLLALVGLYFAVSRGSPATVTQITQIDGACSRAECRLSKRLLRYRDASHSNLNPCMSLYQYQCATYQKNHPLKDMNGISVQLDHEIEERRKLKDRLKEIASQGAESSTDKILAKFYSKCESENKEKKDAVADSIRILIRQLNRADKPTDLIRTAMKNGIPTPFAFELARHRDETTIKTIILIRANHFWKTGGKKDGIDFFMDLKNDFFINLMNRTNEGDPVTSLKNVLAFKERCEKAFEGDGSPARYRYQKYSTSKLAIGEIERGRNDQDKNIDFEAIFKGLDFDMDVLIENPEHWSRLVTANISTDELRDTLILNALLTYGPFFLPKMLDDRHVYEQLTIGPKIFRAAKQSRGDWCLSKIAEYMPQYLACMMGAPDETSRNKITDIFNNIKGKAHFLFTTSTITTVFPEKVEQQFADKILTMNILIGKPGKEICKKEMDRVRHSLGSMNEKSAFEIALEMARTSFNYILDSARDELERERWVSSPLSAYSHYSYHTNCIELSPMSATGVFYDSDLHQAYNYPTLGFIIARHIMHALDKFGRYFDEFGIYLREDEHDMMENATAEMDKNLDATYKNYRGCDNLDPKYPGNNPIENFADFNGLHLAYVAMTNILGGDPAPQVPDLVTTADALFFLIFASSMCESSSFNYKKMLDSGPYAQARYRVNVPASQSIKFSKSFNCSNNEHSRFTAIGVREQEMNPYLPWYAIGES